MLEVYAPYTYISQTTLEEHYGVSAEQYTLRMVKGGLAIMGDAEDVNSMSLTITHSLLKKDKGRLAVSRWSTLVMEVYGMDGMQLLL